VATLEVGSVSGVAQVVSEHLPQNTSQTARKVYAVLVEVGIRVEQERGHAPSVVESVFHAPVELVAEAAGVSRVSVWRHLPALRALGVVDCRTHKARWRGGEVCETRNSGTVWRVRLTPRRGSTARVSADDLRHRWRGAEMRGAASKRALKRTQEFQERSLKIQVLVDWTLSPGSINPVAMYVSPPAQSGLEALLALTGGRRQERAGAVDRGAQALSQALRDSSSLNWYRRLLWQLLRRYDATGQDESYRVFLAAQRAAVDAREWDGLRRPGGLLVSRLRGAEWFAEMMAAPPVRVGAWG
jgi:hypothetical protein